MLVSEMERAGAQLWLQTTVRALYHRDGRFLLDLDREGQRHRVQSDRLVLATGGKSIPKMGATGLAYDIARQFDLPVTETRAALVPLTFSDKRFADISGVSVPARVTTARTTFDESLLFTHRGLSGPAILQASSYWRDGEAIRVNLFPDTDLWQDLRAKRARAGRMQVKTVLSQTLPARLVDHLAPSWPVSARPADLSDPALPALGDTPTDWHLPPTGCEGHRTAEVTLGGSSTGAFSSATMECKTVPGLFAIGEAMDVTGWLGGYNFQWAWASGHAAGQALKTARH